MTEIPLTNQLPTVAGAAWIDALYRSHAATLRTYIYYYVRDPDLADDLLADVFERVLHHASSYDQAKGSPHAWLVGIARNLVRMHFRRQRRFPWLPLDVYIAHQLGQTTVEEQVLARARQSELTCAIQQLPLRQQECLVMKFIEGLNNREIAAVMGLREDHIGTIVYRALRAVRTSMSDRSEGAEI